MIRLAQTHSPQTRVVQLQGALHATLADATLRGTRVGVGLGLLAAIATIVYLSRAY